MWLKLWTLGSNRLMSKSHLLPIFSNWVSWNTYDLTEHLFLQMFLHELKKITRLLFLVCQSLLSELCVNLIITTIILSLFCTWGSWGLEIFTLPHLLAKYFHPDDQTAESELLLCILLNYTHTSFMQQLALSAI